MTRVEAKVPKSMVEKLDMVATVDELTRGEVIRMALREYLDELDLEWYEDQMEEETDDSDSEEEDE